MLGRGGNVNINLSKDEFRDLIVMVYIAEWVLNAHKIGEDPRTVRYEELEQKLFKLAIKNGLDDLVEYDEKYKTHFPTRELEEGLARVFIDEYDNDSFWEELASRLATRDFVNRYGGFEVAWELPVERRLMELGELDAKYSDEFVEHGLARIRIKNSRGGS